MFIPECGFRLLDPLRAIHNTLFISPGWFSSVSYLHELCYVKTNTKLKSSFVHETISWSIVDFIYSWVVGHMRLLFVHLNEWDRQPYRCNHIYLHIDRICSCHTSRHKTHICQWEVLLPRESKRKGNVICWMGGHAHARHLVNTPSSIDV